MMIDNITIGFGYGDILVHSYLWMLQLDFIDTQYTCGEYIDILEENIPNIIKTISIPIDSLDKINEIRLKLNKVHNKEIHIFAFEEYLFDFSNWNKKSIQICIDAIEDIRSKYLLAIAA